MGGFFFFYFRFDFMKKGNVIVYNVSVEIADAIGISKTNLF